jgi:hypothetical protein
LAGLVREVGRDVSGRDVRVVSDVGIPEIGEVRHLRPGADARVLELHEGSRLGVGVEDRAGAKVTERSDRHALADHGVHGDRVRSDLGTGRDRGLPAQNGEGMDDDVGLELDRCVDPGRRGIDDRHAVQHVRFVDPVAKRRSGLRELRPVVDPDRLGRVVRAPGFRASTGGDDVRDRVGQIELALRVACVELAERIA